jgi:DNA-binding CsgD family transcriptional regulator
MLIDGVEYWELTPLGYRDYAISINGWLKSFRGIGTPIIEGGLVNLKHSDSDHYDRVRVEWLVAEIWHHADFERIWESPYKDILLRARSYYSRPPRERRMLPMVSSMGYHYAINSRGEVWQLTQFRLLKPQIGATGYPHVTIGHTAYDIHRLLGLYFIPVPKRYIDAGLTTKDLIINHINGDKTDFRLKNLEWCTPGENIAKASETGLMNTTIDKKTIRKVWKMLSEGKTDIEIAKELNLVPVTVNSIRIGRTNRYRTNEFTWREKSRDLDAIDKRNEKIVEMYRSGKGPLAISKELGTSTRSIQNIIVQLRKEGKIGYNNPNDATPKSDRLNNEVVIKICEMLRDGKDNGTIGKLLGVKPGIITSIRDRRQYALISLEYSWQPFNEAARDRENIKREARTRRIHKLFTKFNSISKVAEKMNISEDIVRRELQLENENKENKND